MTKNIRVQDLNMLVVYTDGCCLGNPGDMGIGVAIYKGPACVEKYGKFLGKGTNNIAEYSAVIDAVEHLSRKGEREVTIRSDSLLLVRQMKGQYSIKEPHLRELARKLRIKMQMMTINFEHIPRERNAVADELSKRAAEKKGDIHEDC